MRSKFIFWDFQKFEGKKKKKILIVVFSREKESKPLHTIDHEIRRSSAIILMS